jgi:DNA-binding CsgD family transcriptional regulator
MWSKINELSRQSLSQMQIALTLGISRDTVRRYQRMSEKEFEGLISSEVLRRKRKLEAFEGFIKE